MEGNISLPSATAERSISLQTGGKLLGDEAPTAHPGTLALPAWQRTSVIIPVVVLVIFVAVSIGFVIKGGSAAGRSQCNRDMNTTWALEGGVSIGATHCIRTFVQMSEAGLNAYSLIDKALTKGVRYQNVAGIGVEWHATFDLGPFKPLPPWFSENRLPYEGEMTTAQWIIPDGYKQQKAESRYVFIHGSDARDSALLEDYAGLTSRLANWTKLPVFAFNYPTEPVVPWPQNIRNVLDYVEYALENGPEGPGRAGSIFFLGDSEGTLVAMQTAISLRDTGFLKTMGYGSHGYGRDSLQGSNDWLAGVVLSSPVVDVMCQTPSFEYNCLNMALGVGDPDTGNCTLTPTLFDRIADCQWSYLSYFYGFNGIVSGRNYRHASALFEKRKNFFEQGILNPLRTDYSSGFPPLLLLAGTRDYYYTDSPSLGKVTCDAGVDVEVFNVVGAFHDFIEYSEGCGGGEKFEEAVEAYRRIAAFTQKHSKNVLV